VETEDAVESQQALGKLPAFEGFFGLACSLSAS
jgi:hypothetical protein